MCSKVLVESESFLPGIDDGCASAATEYLVKGCVNRGRDSPPTKGPPTEGVNRGRRHLYQDLLWDLYGIAIRIYYRAPYSVA